MSLNNNNIKKIHQYLDRLFFFYIDLGKVKETKSSWKHFINEVQIIHWMGYVFPYSSMCVYREE